VEHKIRNLLSRPTRIEYGSQKHNYICDTQGVSVYTNVSANYMFRSLLVRPSSGWIPWSEEIYNDAIQPLKLGGNEISFTKMGHVYKLVVLKYALFTLVCGNIFIHYW